MPIIKPEGGIWADWTPQVNQGANLNIAKTIAAARYTIVGKTMHVIARMTMSAAGVANNGIQIANLPRTIYAYGASIFGVGGCFIRDTGTADYKGTCIINPTDQVVSFRRGDTTGASEIGVDPNFALASGDIISFEFYTEIV